MDKFPYECTRCHRDYRAMSMVNMDDYAMTGICMHCYCTIPFAALREVIDALEDERGHAIERIGPTTNQDRCAIVESNVLFSVIQKLTTLIDKEQS